MKTIKHNIFIRFFYAFLFFGVFINSYAYTYAEDDSGALNFLTSSMKKEDLQNVPINLYISQFYRAALILGAFLAVGAIIFGALQKILYASSPDKQNDANDRITSAIWGLVLLLGSVVILQTVNPEITSLKLPEGLPTCENIIKENVEPKPYKNCLPGWHLITSTCPPNGGKILVNGQEVDQALEINCLPLCKPNENRCTPGDEYKAGANCVKCIKASATGKCPAEAFQLCAPTVSECSKSYRVLDANGVWQASDPTNPQAVETPDCKEGERIIHQHPYYDKELGKNAWNCETYMIETYVMENGKLVTRPQKPTEELNGFVPCDKEAASFTEVDQTIPSNLSHESIAALLKENNIGVWSSRNCSTRTQKGCTSFEGLPLFVVDKLKSIKNGCGCNVMVTGGTETGHKSHGVGIPVIDLNFNRTIAEYLIRNSRDLGIKKICTTYADKEFRIACNWNEERQHLHVAF